MDPNSIQVAELAGFKIHDWGYKKYYSYKTSLGELKGLSSSTVEIDPQADLDECAELAALWYKQPASWCRSRLESMLQQGFIAHLGAREHGKLVASCLVASNYLRSSTAAVYYIYAADKEHLIPLLVKVVENCIEYGSNNLIADLINEHRQFEPVYQELGFEKVAEWALCEKDIDQDEQ